MKLFFSSFEKAVISFLLLVVPTTFGTTEFVPVAGFFFASGHSARDLYESDPSDSEYHLLYLVFLDLVLPHLVFLHLGPSAPGSSESGPFSKNLVLFHQVLNLVILFI